MPKLQAKVEGKGKGAKTVIINMHEIAKLLNRPPMYPLKHMGSSLGAQVNFDNKNDRYTIGGARDQNKLQELLDCFTQKYVVCQSCNNSKTTLTVSAKNEIEISCTSCGISRTLPATNDPLATYIIQNPPTELESALTNNKSDQERGSKSSQSSTNQPEQLSEDNLMLMDDLEELDYGDDDDEFDYDKQSSSQQLYNDSMSQPNEEDENEDEDEDEDEDDDENIEDDDDRDAAEAGQSDTEKGDKVRCRYWPACNAQDSCQFYHPTKPCRDFMRCTFGDKCLYIHPPCKFSPNCTKPRCPFSHPAAATTGIKRKASAMQFRSMQPAAPKCKFGFKCTNLMCRFSHERSEDCRYGANCLLEDCPYNHPTDSMPPRKKPTSVFKWTAQS